MINHLSTSVRSVEDISVFHVDHLMKEDAPSAFSRMGTSSLIRKDGKMLTVWTVFKSI
jgi:hypothetical protein